MGFVALCIFLGLFLKGQEIFDWYDPTGKVQLALFLAFILGIVCGIRVKD